MPVMNLIKPSYEILTDLNVTILQHLEMAGRTCYKTEVGSTPDFIKKRIETGHESVIEHSSITIRFICDRGVSHELVRHRLCSFSQESTRYCNYSKDQLTFIIPCWFTEDVSEITNLRGFGPEMINFGSNTRIWLHSMFDAEENYNVLISQGWQPQQARSILPNSLKTEIVMTTNIREWRLILKQRTSKAAHPQMRELMIPLLTELKRRLPVVFDDINPE